MEIRPILIGDWTKDINVLGILINLFINFNFKLEFLVIIHIKNYEL